jgi:hypothetical protein
MSHRLSAGERRRLLPNNRIRAEQGGVFNHVTYEFWRRRHLDESYPVFLEELQWMAKEANLVIKAKAPCTTPIGVEHLVLFERAATQT